MTRGRRGSLALRRRAFSSPSPCRFIPAHRRLRSAPRRRRAGGPCPPATRCQAAAAARPPSGCKPAVRALPGTSPAAPARAGRAGDGRSPLVIPPSHPVRARRVLLARTGRPFQQLRVTWCSSAVNRASLSFRATSRTRPRSLDTPTPALRPERVSLPVFPTTQLPFLPCLLSSHLVRQARRYYEAIRLPAPVHPGITAAAFPRRPARRPRGRAGTGPPGSRARRFRTCHGSLTARGPQAARDSAARGVAFRPTDSVGTPGSYISRLNSPACTCPCQRFTPPLTGRSA